MNVRAGPRSCERRDFADYHSLQYHDDGERGLGPFVASISLGSDALMSFRRKEPKNRPYGNKKADRSKAATNGAEMTAAVQAAGEPGAVDDAEERAVPTLDGFKRKSSMSRVALKIRLKHGDVMLMEVRDLPPATLGRKLPR